MTAAEMIGRTVHIARGARYDGAREIAEATEREDGWIHITSTSGWLWYVRPEHVFATEEEARAAVRARRRLRTPRTYQPLYGDFAQLAMLNGIRTDGTGRRVR